MLNMSSVLHQSSDSLNSAINPESAQNPNIRFEIHSLSLDNYSE